MMLDRKRSSNFMLDSRESMGDTGLHSIREMTEGDTPLSQSKQAYFTLALIVTCIVSLFALAPRLAFSGLPNRDPFQLILFILQQTFSFVYLILYALGASELQRMRVKELKAMMIVSSTGQQVDEKKKDNTSGALSLDDPTHFFFQVVCASVIPIVTDFIMLATGNQALRWVGCLRLLNILEFGAAFSSLSTNLSLPAYLTPMLRCVLIMCFTTHYAACFYWLLARWKGYTEDTWVGTHRPWLIDASANMQYITSLYFSVITVSTVGYGDIYPVSKSEVTTTILYVLMNILLMANIIGVVSALAALEDTDLAEQRARIGRVERMLDTEKISTEVAMATLEYMRLALRFSKAEIDTLPLSVRTRIRAERFGDLLEKLPLFKGTSDRFVRECIALVKEDSFVKGLEIMRRGDLGSRLIIILEGHATLEVTTMSDDELLGHYAVVTGKDYSAAILHNRSCFGTEGFVCDMPQPFTVRAQTLLRVVSIDEEDRRELERCHPNDWSKLRSNLLNITNSLKSAAEAILHQISNGTASENRLKIEHLRMSLEAPALMPEACAERLVTETETIIEGIKSESSRASHSLSALHCHVASTGDAKELRALTNLVPVSEVQGDYDGRTALHLAAGNGHVQCVKLLLDAGSDPNPVDRFGRTPLLEAVLHDEAEVIDLLMERGGELKMKPLEAAQELCKAASTGDLKLLHNYLKAGMNPNASDYDLRTCLMVAAAEGSSQMCRELLSFGANAMAKDRWGHTPADEAKTFGHTGALYDMLKKAEENALSDHEKKWQETRSRLAVDGDETNVEKKEESSS